MEYKLESYFEYICDKKDQMNPISGQLNITNTCVNTCRYCKKQTFPQVEMSYEKITEVVDDISDMGIRSLMISGGEPLLHSRIYDVLEYINKKRISISMVTSLAKEVDLEKIATYVSRINVSYDADDAELYYKTRGKGDIDLVKKQLKELNKLKSVYDPHFYKLIYDFQLNIWTVHSTINDHQIGKIKKFISKLKNANHVINEIKSYEKLKVNPSIGYKKNCWYNYINFIIDASGIVMNCCKLMHDNEDYKTINKSLIMGNVNENRFKGIWNSQRARDIRNEIFRIRYDECSECDRAIPVNDKINEYFSQREDKKRRIFL